MHSVLGRADGMLTLEKYTKTILSSSCKNVKCKFGILCTAADINIDFTVQCDILENSVITQNKFFGMDLSCRH